MRYQRLNKEHIQMFLKELNHTKFYEDIIYIYHKKSLINLQMTYLTLKLKLMEDFDTLIEKYDAKNTRMHLITNGKILSIFNAYSINYC